MVYLHSPRVFQSLIVLSREPETANWPSEEITTSSTKWPWPRRAFLGYP